MTRRGGSVTDQRLAQVPRDWRAGARSALRSVGAGFVAGQGAGIGDELWGRLAGEFGPEQLLDLLMLAGWHHAVSFTANAARVAGEDGAPRFADLRQV